MRGEEPDFTPEGTHVRATPSATPGDYVIWTRCLAKAYRRGPMRPLVRALQGLDLDVRPGEIFGYLGQNGAGKSTTIKILVGLISATSGEARVSGAPAGARAARACLGYLPENPALPGLLTAREFLSTSARLMGLGSAAARAEIESLSRSLDLEPILDRRLGKLSKGQSQLAGIASALLGSPSLLILDEPMSGLDPMARKRVRDLFLERRSRGSTVFFSSHILGDVELLCDRVALLREGRLVGIYRLSEIRDAGGEAMELVVSGITADELRETAPGLGPARPTDDRLVVEVPAAARCTEIVRALVGRGAEVHALTPRGGRLEAFVLSAIAGDRNPSAGRPAAGPRAESEASRRESEGLRLTGGEARTHIAEPRKAAGGGR